MGRGEPYFTVLLAVLLQFFGTERRCDGESSLDNAFAFLSKGPLARRIIKGTISGSLLVRRCFLNGVNGYE
jgi:hypothetical protein